jgi:hypothetical protein
VGFSEYFRMDLGGISSPGLAGFSGHWYLSYGLC